MVASSGVALINVICALDGVQTVYDEERQAIQILRRALEEPLRQLARNSGEDGAVIIDNVRRAQKEEGNTTIGYNVITGVYGNMLEQGVPDPVKVTRTAVQNAISIASMILTTDVLIADMPESS